MTHPRIDIPDNALASAEPIVAIHASGASLDGPVHTTADLAGVPDRFIIGETASRLGDAFHERHASVPWRRTIDHRNLIAHGYDTVDGTARLDHRTPTADPDPGDRRHTGLLRPAAGRMRES
jgi:hypothetical protein